MGNFLIRHYRSLFTILLIAMLFLAFFLGFITGKQQSGASVALQCSPEVLEKLAIPVARLSNNAITGERIVAANTTGAFVGSKNGTKYYTPTCSGVKRIKPENYVWFENAQDAELQGYSRATAC